MEQFRALKNRATWDVVGPTVTFGATCGLLGSIGGALYAAYRPYPRPGLYAALAFLQYSAYGTLFQGSRSYYLYSLRPFSDTPPTSPPSRFDLLTSSSLGGATSGFVLNAVFRQRFIMSATLQGCLYGYLGQRGWMWVDERHTRKVEREERRIKAEDGGEKEETVLEKVAGWAGMRKMSDEEYEGILRERALGLEAEIRLMDERIEELKREREEEKGKKLEHEKGQKAEKVKEQVR